MRLTPEQVTAIKAAAREAFGDTAVVRLFGSRVDDTLRGGDIHLHIEAATATADLEQELRFRAAIWKALDEEQIDVVVAQRGAEARWIDCAARRDRIIL